MAIERTRVRRVQVKSASRRVRNIVIGAAIGLAVGLVADQTLGTYLRNEAGEQWRPRPHLHCPDRSVRRYG